MNLSPYARAIVGSGLAVGFCVALVHCGDDDSSSGPMLDGIDSSLPNADSTPGPEVDSGREAGTDAGDAGKADAGDAGDAGKDAAPIYDDAGCSIPQDPLPELADAGFPTTGLILWLRADRGVSTTDAGALCGWRDQSGKSHDFVVDPVAAPFTAPPQVTPSAINGKPAVSVSGTTAQIHREDTLGLPTNSARTYVAFGATADTTGRFDYLFQAATDPSDNVSYAGFDMNTFNSSPSKEGVYMTANAYEANVATTTAPRVHVYAVDDMTVGGDILSSIHYDVDGVATTLTHTPAGIGNGKFLDFSPASRTFVGLAQSATFTGAAIGEVMLFDRSLNAADRTAINTYFENRYPK